MVSHPLKRIAIVGGAGYVGSALVPFLLEKGYAVKVVDLFLFGEDVFAGIPDKRRLTCLRADVRNEQALQEVFQGMDAIIHLACVSNDPSFELDPELGRSINYDAMPGILRAVKAAGVRRFIYASSSSVYGVQETPHVREDAPCEPLTDYSRYKLLCEKLLSEHLQDTTYSILRPATVCGYAPRLRLDLTVNLLTLHALVKKEMTVFGGTQLRPHIHIQDMVDAYQLILEAPQEKVHGQIYNVGCSNLSVSRIAELIRDCLGDKAVRIRTEPSKDLRSYHVNSDKIRDGLGFTPRHRLEEAIIGLEKAYRAGIIPDPLNEPRYYNVKVMQQTDLRHPVPDIRLLPA